MYRTVRTYNTYRYIPYLYRYRYSVPTVQYSTVHTYRLSSHYFLLLHKTENFVIQTTKTPTRKSPSYSMNTSNNIHTPHFPIRHQNRTTRSTPKLDYLSVYSPDQPSFNTISDLQWQRATNNKNNCAQNPNYTVIPLSLM